MEVVQAEYKARVTNTSDRPYKEMYRGKEVNFGPHESQVWDYDDAVIFKGQFIPVVRNDTGQYLTEKRIKVEKIVDENAPKRVVGFQNPLNGKIFGSEDEMKADMNLVRANFTPIKVDDTARVDTLANKVEAQGQMMKDIMAAVSDLAKAISKPPVSGRGRKVTNDTAGTDGRST
jgi:hypothetical protein